MFLQITNCIVVLLLCFANVYGVDLHDFDRYQNQLTRSQVEQKIKTYLEKDPSVSDYYRITDESLTILDLKQGQVEYVLLFAAAPQPDKPKIKKTLQKARIAIDPGHFGGAFAELEERFIAIPSGNKLLSFNEGTLTYLTALALKELLEKEGAEVFVTRSDIGRGAIKESFFEWLEKQPHLWISGDSLPQLFRKYYNRADLIARADLINAFAPDVTIMIHYNDHPMDEKDTVAQANYNIIFIPGAFSCNELSRPQDRYEFLRLVVTDKLKSHSNFRKRLPISL